MSLQGPKGIKSRTDGINPIIDQNLTNIEEMSERLGRPLPMSWAAWKNLRINSWHDDGMTTATLQARFRRELREVTALTPNEHGRILLNSALWFLKNADAGDGPEFAQTGREDGDADRRLIRRGANKVATSSMHDVPDEPVEDEGDLGEEDVLNGAEDGENEGDGEEVAEEEAEEDEEVAQGARPAEVSDNKYTPAQLVWINTWCASRFVSSSRMPRGWTTQIRVDFAANFSMSVDDIPPYSLKNIKQSMAQLGQFTVPLPDYTDPSNYPSRNAKRNQT